MISAIAERAITPTSIGARSPAARGGAEHPLGLESRVALLQADRDRGSPSVLARRGDNPPAARARLRAGRLLQQARAPGGDRRAARPAPLSGSDTPVRPYFALGVRRETCDSAG